MSLDIDRSEITDLEVLALPLGNSIDDGARLFGSAGLLATAKSQGKPLCLLAGTYTVADTYTLASTDGVIRLLMGAAFAVASGKTLSIACPFTQDVPGATANTGSGTLTVTSSPDAATTFLLNADEIDFNTKAGVASSKYVTSPSACAITFDAAVTGLTVTQATRASTGANAGATTTIRAQAGQLQTGVTANNNGGELVLASGAAGTGGSGAAATAGPITVKQGTTTIAAFSHKAPDGSNFGNYLDFGSVAGGISMSGSGSMVSTAPGGDAYYASGPSNSVFLGSTALYSAIAITATSGAVVTQAFASTAVTPTIMQADVVTNSATGAALTIQAQNATGSTANGGALVLASGTGTTAAGAVSLKAGTTVRLTANATGLGFYAGGAVAQASRVGQLGNQDVGASPSQSSINTAINNVLAKVNSIETAIHNIGLTA